MVNLALLPEWEGTMKRRIKGWFGGSDELQIRLPNGVIMKRKRLLEVAYFMGLIGETSRQYWLDRDISRSQWEGIIQLLTDNGLVDRVDGRGRVYLQQVGEYWWDTVKRLADQSRTED